MNYSAEIQLDWGGEPERAFRLGIGQIKKLQEKTGAGPTGIAARCLVTLAVLGAQRRHDYVAIAQMDLSNLAEAPMLAEVHLQALMGAGVPAPEALKLVREWVEERPLAESLASAYRICNASVYGPEDEPLGEPEGEEVASPSPTESSASPTYTAPEPS